MQKLGLKKIDVIATCIEKSTLLKKTYMHNVLYYSFWSMMKIRIFTLFIRSMMYHFIIRRIYLHLIKIDNNLKWKASTK